MTIRLITVVGLILLIGCGGAKIRNEVHHVSPLTGEIDKVTFIEKTPESLYYGTIQAMYNEMGEQKPTLEITFEKSTGTNHYQSIESLIRSIGNDINDLEGLLTHRKSQNYDIDAIRNAVRRLRSTASPAITTAFFAGVTQGSSNSILPVIKQRQRIDWAAVLALLERIPTTGENWKNGLVEGLRSLGIPLAIATMGVMHVQSSRTSEEIAPNNINTAGGDQSQGAGVIDNSQPVSESFNTPTEIKKSYNTTEITGAE